MDTPTTYTTTCAYRAFGRLESALDDARGWSPYATWGRSVSVLLAETVALIGWGALGTRALVGIMGKPDRALIVSCAAIFGFFFGLGAYTPAAAVIAVGGLATMAQRVIWVVRHAG